MKHIASLLLVAALLLGCKPSHQESATDPATNSFYQMGLAEGHRHLVERPETSLMVFPKDSTNWSKASLESYRSGYLAGLGSK